MSNIYNYICLFLSAGTFLVQGCDTVPDIASEPAAETNLSDATPDDASSDSANLNTDATLETETNVCDAMLSGSSFHVLDAPFCGYTNYLHGDDISIVNVSAEDEDTFVIETSGGERSICNLVDCSFECEDIGLATIAVDGIDLESGEDVWATIDYSMTLSGTVDSNGVRDIEALAAVICIGHLCGEENCEGDISQAITWQPSSDSH